MPILRSIISLLVFFAVGAAAAEVSPIALRNQHPVLHVYGLPTFQTAAVEKPGEGTVRLTFDMANHAETGDNRIEALVLDGESYFLNLSWRRGFKDWLEVGIDVPLVSHSGGALDGVIKNWHDIWGLSNSKRKGPDDQQQFLFSVDDMRQLEVVDSVSGIGDVQLTAGIPLSRKNENGKTALALRFGVKLPTGDADDLLGSGAVDGSVGLYGDSAMTLFGQSLGISGFAGVLGLGSGDVLSDRQRDFVPFGGGAMTWRASDRLGITAQFQVQGSYIDSDLDELGGSSVQLGFGASYRFRENGWMLTCALVEDLISDATPDVGFFVGFSKTR